MPSLKLALLVASVLASPSRAQQASFQQWCGKYYQVGAPQPDTPPSGGFVYPDLSSTPLLDFRCTTASSLYLQGDEANDPPMILVDANITTDVGQAYHGASGSNMSVTVFLGNQQIAQASVVAGSLGSLLPFNLTSTSPSNASQPITCTAQVNGQNYTTNSSLVYLPANPHGGVVKIDRRSGGLLVRNFTTQSQMWEPFFPFGFYDLYNTSVVDNTYNDTLNRLYQAKDLGFNIIHPVEPAGPPDPYPDWRALEHYLDVAESLGLWVMYSMSSSFTNLTVLDDQVFALRNRSNMLLWYTGDEPDGKQTPPESLVAARQRLFEIDPYHPVGLALNCENWWWSNYTAGADILFVDPYPIALNGGWSKEYGTVVDTDFGVSGCDNCVGSFYDIVWRLESSRDRARIEGKYRDMPVMVVPQLFSDQQDQFWWRTPFGDEGQVNVILAVNHGATGSCAWNSYGTTQDLLNNASVVATGLYGLTDFIYGAADTRKEMCSSMPYCGKNNIDIASWTKTHDNGTVDTLLLVANMQYNSIGSTINFSANNITGTVLQTFWGNVTQVNDTALFTMPRTSIAGAIIRS